MNKQVNYFFLGMISLMISGFTLTGYVQKIVKFQDPLNEFAFCIMFGILGILMISGAFVSDIKDSK